MSAMSYPEDLKQRERFNSLFRKEQYIEFLADLNSMTSSPAEFRVAETPLFFSDEFNSNIIKAAEEIVGLLQAPAFKSYAASAIPPGQEVPNEDEHPVFLQVDLAIVKLLDGSYEPRLIELQGFPSLYCYQILLLEAYRKHFDIPEEWSSYYSGLSRESYIKFLHEAIVADVDPSEVILLEIAPETQKTRIDFDATRDLLGVRTVSVSEVRRERTRLYYLDRGMQIPIRRIYNRVIFDELDRKRPAMAFRFQDDLDVVWVGHPNWYYRISKHTLPFLKSRFVPDCRFLSDYARYPDDLENYVLKPLYSFAGSGVVIEITPEVLKSVTNPHQYVLQRKTEYVPFVQTMDEPSKAEVRMMFLWKDKPVLVNNLVRLSKGKMMGVDFNKNKTWVGSSIALHR
jgi:hypothetical protein